MTTPTSNAAKAIVALLLVGGIGAAALNPKFYNGAFIDSFFAFTVASFLIIYLRIRPKWVDVSLVVGGAVLLAIADFGILHYQPKIMACLSFLGLSSMVIMPIQALWAEKAERKLLLYGFVPVLPFVILGFLMPRVLAWTITAHPKTLELYLLSFDSSLRVQLSFIAGQAFARSLWLAFAGWFFYMALPVPIAVVYAGRLVRAKEKALEAIVAFLIAGPVGMVFYNIFPATGPRYLFGQGFPFHVFPISQAPRLLLEPVAIQDGFRNAMPSLHITCVLLACWYSRGLSWWERAITYVFFAFTVFATLGTGEHWFVDLIVAFPFALFIQAICSSSLAWNNARRLTAFFLGLSVTAGWLLGLRYAAKFFWISPVIPWALVVGTIALTSIWQSQLAQAIDSPEGAEKYSNEGIPVAICAD
jgi:PAP2 superfamily